MHVYPVCEWLWVDKHEGWSGETGPAKRLRHGLFFIRILFPNHVAKLDIHCHNSVQLDCQCLVCIIALYIIAVLDAPLGLVSAPTTNATTGTTGPHDTGPADLTDHTNLSSSRRSWLS